MVRCFYCSFYGEINSFFRCGESSLRVENLCRKKGVSCAEN